MTNSVNYLWLDSETTGLDAHRNDIIQFACIPVIAGNQMPSSFNQFCQPTNWSSIDDEALKIHGISRDKLATFQSPETMVDNLIKYLRQFNVKFTIAGFNVGFDKDFLTSLFKKVKREHEYFELFTQDLRDTYKRAKKLKAQLPTANLKLKTLAEHFNIEIDAHNAISDITATIHLDKILSDMLGETEVYVTETHKLLDVHFPEPAQLHIHSKFSHTDSINSIDEWAEWCERNDVPGFAAVDHGNAASLFDIVRIPDLFKKSNKKLEKDGKPLLTKKVTGIPGCGFLVDHGGFKFYLNGWATSNQGYNNIVKLASIGWTNRITDSNVEFPVLSLQELIQYRKDIVFGVPGINGPVAQYILSRQPSSAESLIEELNRSLDIRLELAAIDVYKYFDSAVGFSGYNIEGGNLQKHINTLYIKLAKKHNIKCVPVSDAHIIDSSDKIVQDCVSKNSFKDARYFAESRHVVKSREMFSILKGHLGDLLTEDDFQEMVINTHDISNLASQINIKHSYHLPKIEIPDDILQKTDDYSMQVYYTMMQKIDQHGRWKNDPIYVERFKKEIDVIMKNTTLNFIPYFLVYEDVCAFARSSGLLQGIARGSAGGSLLSYYLKIIHVDPVAANLPFERFLSHARINAGSFPDIDLDIADRARPLVMKYLQDKYGLGFAQISTFSTMKTKNAIKDAMYALYGRNRRDEEVMAVCDQIDDSPQGVDEYDFLYGYTDQEGEEHKGEVEKKPILANFFQQKPEVEEMVKKLLGSIRGWSRHASAFVISTLDLADGRVPTMLMTDKNLGDILVTQFDAAMVEKSALVKADILGIKTLTMASDAMAMIKKNHNIDFLEEINGVPLVYRLPDADIGVFTDFYKKDTDSSFQFNTDLIKGYAQEFAPLNRSDLMAMTALCRPGALDAPLYDTMAAQYFMDVKNHKRTVEYLHPDLEPILRDFNGVFVYQEEVMRFLVEIVGYTWEESDIIRSAIAKKKHEVIMATFDKIRASCKQRGWSNDAIETICHQIQAFSRYSFNKSHSYAYAELGYITLYLKNHYPLEWWCGVLNNEDKEDKTRAYISYLGSKITSPSLKVVSDSYSIANGKIVAPISAIKSVGPAAVKELMAKGPFISLEDFMSRVDHARVNIGTMSAIIKARAADELMESFSDEPDFAEHINGMKSYIDARKDFMLKYIALKKGKTNFKDDMWNISPIDVFLQEKEYNKSFNKSFLSDRAVQQLLMQKWPGLKATQRAATPFVMNIGRDEEQKSIPILSGIKIAQALALKASQQEVGMILLFQGSSYKEGISKKSGRPWRKVDVVLSDGYNNIEVTRWDASKAFGWNKDAVVYVSGIPKIGWRGAVTMNIEEIERVE